MKAIGIVRKVDSLGRIVLPIELRKNFGINIKDPLEIYVEEDAIILKKYSPQCVLCGSSDYLIVYRGKRICKKCIIEFDYY